MKNKQVMDETKLIGEKTFWSFKIETEETDCDENT